MFLCPADIVRRVLCFWVVLPISVSPSRCGFQSLYLSVLQISYWDFAYILPMFCLQTSTDFQVTRSKFKATVTIYVSTSVLQIFSRFFAHTLLMVVFRHLLVLRSPGQRSRLQWPIFLSTFAIIFDSQRCLASCLRLKLVRTYPNSRIFFIVLPLKIFYELLECPAISVDWVHYHQALSLASILFPI